MSSRPTFVFPPGTSPVRKDKDLYLLHCRYSRMTDTLRILYKNRRTNEKILDEIQNPSVPVFFAKRTPKFFKDFIPYDECYPVMVSLRNKSTEIQHNLFPTKSWKYRDKEFGIERTQVGFVDIKPDTMKKKPEYLHPQLMFADVPVEHLVNMEYCIDKYEDLGNDVRMEVIPPPKLDFAAFDIETSIDKFGNPFINANTYVDDKTKKAYLYYLVAPFYKNQDFIKDNPEEFEAMFRDRFKWAIDNMTLNAKPDKVKYVKEVCYEYLKELKVVTKGFDTEAKLIYESCDLMFTQNSPDLLMAFNTGYDMPMFQRRISELGLPVGTINSHAKKEWINTPPPIAEDLNKFWELRSDAIDPKKRATCFDNISKTHVVDYANAYYSNRKGGTFSAMSLDATSERELGLGKLDYSKICNHILKLPYADFVTHGLYALVDSVLVLILEKITHDFDSKLAYVLRTKSDMKSTASNNQAISRCIHAEAFYAGHVAGNNWKKYLDKFTNEEFKQITNITGIDYPKLNKLYETLPGKVKGDIKGGIVGNPNGVRSMFKKLVGKFNILYNEVILTRFKKYPKSIYVDAVSHYPVAIITRNLGISTMFGDIVSIIREKDKEVIKTARWRDRGKDNYIPHLGGINLTIVNKDPVAFGERTMGLPSMGEIASAFVPADSEPKTKPKIHLNLEIDVPKNRKVETSLLMVLSELNSEAVSSAEAKNGLIDMSGMFLLNDGETTFCRSYIKYDYNNNPLLNALSQDSINEPALASRSTEKVVIDNSKLILPENIPPVFSGEFTSISDDDIIRLSEATTFTTEFMFGSHKAYVPRYQLYFPFKHYIDKQLEKEYAIKGGSDKYVMVENYRYRVLSRKKTYSTELKFDIKIKNYHLTVTQIIDWVNLEFSE